MRHVRKNVVHSMNLNEFHYLYYDIVNSHRFRNLVGQNEFDFAFRPQFFDMFE